LWGKVVCEDAEDLWAAGTRDIIFRAAGDICIRQAISRIWSINIVNIVKINIDINSSYNR
jgi:hypothetical protein